MGLLFVPLTTITNAGIPKEEMGNATSLFNLMRNIGASIGIASVTTIVARHSQTHTNILGQHITPNDPAAVSMMMSLKNGMMAAGMDATTAAQQAYAMAFAMVQRQAAMLSYIDVFRLLAVLFVVVIPLILIMRKPKQGGGGSGVAH
jgi:DHA2 family multidrug resistance protein